MTPEQEEQVRLALAAAARADRGDTGGDTPSMPAEVVDRLDRVLAELVAGRAARSPATIDTDASVAADEVAARRKRKWPNVLVAAAAVAVIAAAGGAVATRGFDGGGGQTSTEAANAQPQLRTTTLKRDIQRLATGGTAEASATPSAPSSERQRPDASASASGGTNTATPGFGGPTLGKATGRAAPGCQNPAAPPGARVIPVLLDGKQATLVLDAPVNGMREARVYSCDDGSNTVAVTSVQQP